MKSSAIVPEVKSSCFYIVLQMLSLSVVSENRRNISSLKLLDESNRQSGTKN